MMVFLSVERTVRGYLILSNAKYSTKNNNGDEIFNELQSVKVPGAGLEKDSVGFLCSKLSFILNISYHFLCSCVV